MINALIGLHMIKKTGANVCKGIFYNYMSKNFNLDDFLNKYQDDLNKGVRTLSLVEPSFVDKEIIEPCYQILKDNVTEDELLLVTNRIKDIRIKKGIFSLTEGGHFNNSLSLIKYYDVKSLMHEFLHMASSYYNKDNNVWMCGFENNYKLLRIGHGLTEGFTELFASRLEKRDIRSYKELTEICEMLEILFDHKDDARKLYFSCDLPSFINKLREYMTDDEVFNLIREMDFLVSSNEMNRSYDIKLFIYKRFMDKCLDIEKIKKMTDLIRKQNATRILSEANNSEIRIRNIEDKNISQHFKKYSKKSIAKAATTVAICTSLLLGNHALAISNKPYNDMKKLVGAHTTDSYFVMLDDNYSLSSEANASSLSGSDLCRSLIANNIKYFEVDGEYYTEDGGEITIEKCEITIRNYVRDAIPIYHENTIINYVAGEDLRDTEYEIKDGKVYSISYITYNQVKLADGSIISPVADVTKDIEESYSIAVIDSFKVYSKKYEDLKALSLIYEDNINTNVEHMSEGKSK